MQTRLWTLFLLLCFVLPFSAIAEPESSNPQALQHEFHLELSGRANLRSGQEPGLRSEIIARADWEVMPEDWWSIRPFVETRRDLDGNAWSRIELGGEVGFKPLAWTYFALGIQQAWRSPGADHMELELRSLADIPLPRPKSFEWSLYLLNEFTFDINDGEGSRNEIGAGINIPLKERFKLWLGWRHVDLIHDADMDQFEAGLQTTF